MGPSHRLSWILLLVLVSATAARAEDGPLTEADYDRLARRMVARDHFPALFDPALVSVKAAGAAIEDDEPVVGVVVGDDVRAYPVHVLGSHGIVNDTCGGVPIAVSWCALCQTAIVYDRRLGDRTLTFGHEGVLYRSSFVMYDKQTGSLWVHVAGEALKGELKGSRLEFLPSEVVLYEAWKRAHPDSKVLVGRKEAGFLGTFGLGDKLPAYGLSVGTGRDVRLYPYERLRASPVFNTVFGERPLTIVFDAESLRTKAFVARAGERTLTFEPLDDAARMRDVETGGTWDRYEGLCLAGALEGARLARLPATPWLAIRWRGFFPDGEVVTKARGG